MNDPFRRLRPTPPPPELRARVLAAAREAASHPAPGLIEALLGDRLLRLCAGAVIALAMAHVWVDRDARAMARESAFESVDDLSVPTDGDLSAAEQLDELAPILELRTEGSRG